MFEERDDGVHPEVHVAIWELHLHLHRGFWSFEKGTDRYLLRVKLGEHLTRVLPAVTLRVLEDDVRTVSARLGPLSADSFEVLIVTD